MKISKGLTILFAIILFATVSASAQKAKPKPNQKPTTVSTVTAEYQRLLTLQSDLKRIPIARQEREPHKSLIRRNAKDIVYSEPAGEWFVRSERFWDLATRHKEMPIAEVIAWTAAKNPLPGECEGYINCYIYMTRVTMGKYLEMFPSGKNASDAVFQIGDWLEPIAQDIGTKSIYSGPEDASDKAEFSKILSELRELVRGAGANKTSQRTLEMIDRIMQAYK